MAFSVALHEALLILAAARVGPPAWLEALHALRQRRKLAFALSVAPADPLRVEPVLPVARASMARLARVVLPAAALLALVWLAGSGDGTEPAFLANLFDELGRWWNGLPLWQQALVIGGGVALLMLGGASWAFALGAIGIAADVASRGQGVATFIRDPRRATSDFFRTLTPADALTYAAGAALNRILGPLLTNRTVGRWLGEAGEEAAETAAERAAREAAEAAPSSRLAPGGGLKVHEALGGHTLARHVGQTPDQLRARLDKYSGLFATSTYTDRAAAEAAIAEATDANQAAIDAWLQTTKGKLEIDHVHDGPVGVRLARDADAPVPVNGSRLVLLRAPASSLGYRILTGFPQLPT